MILEHAVLPVRPGQEADFEAAIRVARPLIAAIPGFRGISVSRGVENPSTYLLVVEWDSVHAHETGFRGSPQYQEWKRLLHRFYDPFPVVEHFAPLLLGSQSPGAPRGGDDRRPHASEFILYVAEQARARAFYQHVLDAEPTLAVPGMTEFDLSGATLGLMPAADLEELLAGKIRTDPAQRCEVYLRRADAVAALERAIEQGATLLDPVRDRPWGERVGYVLDPDGHVLALAINDVAR